MAASSGINIDLLNSASPWHNGLGHAVDVQVVPGSIPGDLTVQVSRKY